MKITGYIRTDKINSECLFDFEIDDDATEEEIAEAAKEQAFQHIEWAYEAEA